MSQSSLDEANALLRVHPLAAMRLVGWERAFDAARLEVFHIEWPRKVFGELRFTGVSYLQIPTQTQWGHQLRIVTEAALPSRTDIDSSGTVYELFAHDGQQPSAFIVADGLECVTASHGQADSAPSPNGREE